jgi:hypothetical protein
MRAPPLALAAALIAALAACSGSPKDPAIPPAVTAPAPADRGPAVRFAFEALDGKPLTAESLAGRVAVIVFLTTYDFPSQAEARFLSGLQHNHAPRINAAALILEPPENRPLAEAFAKSLSLGYPVALADAATIAGEGPFAGLHHVPSVVILDRRGREAWRHVGLAEEAEIEEAVRGVEKADR